MVGYLLSSTSLYFSHCIRIRSSVSKYWTKCVYTSTEGQLTNTQLDCVPSYRELWVIRLHNKEANIHRKKECSKHTWSFVGDCQRQVVSTWPLCLDITETIENLSNKSRNQMQIIYIYSCTETNAETCTLIRNRHYIWNYYPVEFSLCCWVDTKLNLVINDMFEF